MILTNYHTHSSYCDGKGSPENYMEAASFKGFTALGFSSHAPIPIESGWTMKKESLEKYITEINSLKNKYQNNIQVYLGLEIDYIPGYQEPSDAEWNNIGLDYSIGSVHSTASLDINPEYFCIDGPLDELEWVIENIHEGSYENLSFEYYRRISQLVKKGGFSILGHFDLLKKRNRHNTYFSEDSQWYKSHVRAALEAFSGSSVIMEINSGAISRGVLEEVYPSPWIIAEAKKMDIPVMVNADAHRPMDIDCCFEDSLHLLKDIGYKNVKMLLDDSWKDVLIDQALEGAEHN
jgi:histidinol-phosphatase (PHP family)